MGCDVEIAVVTDVDQSELVTLYSAVDWRAYTADPVGLARAVSNSDFVVTAVCEHGLVGLARAISDDVSIFYLQDILVAPGHHRTGIGTRLLTECLERYDHVRQKILMTDDLPSQHAFYRSLGYVDTRELDSPPLHTFVHFR